MTVDTEEAVARLRSARVGRIATITPHGRPHVVPFVFALVEGDTDLHLYWAVDDKPKRSPILQRLRNLEANPSVAAVVDGYDEDWTRLWWVRVSGTGRVVASDVERLRALDALAAKYPRYRASPPEGAVVAIDVEGIDGWRADADPA